MKRVGKELGQRLQRSLRRFMAANSALRSSNRFEVIHEVEQQMFLGIKRRRMSFFRSVENFQSHNFQTLIIRGLSKENERLRCSLRKNEWLRIVYAFNVRVDVNVQVDQVVREQVRLHMDPVIMPMLRMHRGVDNFSPFIKNKPE